jgi:uncharacterized protein
VLNPSLYSVSLPEIRSTSESDVDLIVEFEGKVTFDRYFDRYMDLEFYLEDCLTVKVDLVVIPKMLKPQIRQTVEREAFLVS